MRAAETTDIATASRKYFTLYCAGEMFGLSVDHAQTIFKFSAITPIPLGGSEILGLVNLRGKIVTAVSLRDRLRLPSSETNGNGFAISIEYGGENFALVVDQVGDVIELEPSMKIPIPPHFDPQRAHLTSGLYRIGKQLVPILNLDALFEINR